MATIKGEALRAAEDLRNTSQFTKIKADASSRCEKRVTVSQLRGDIVELTAQMKRVSETKTASAEERKQTAYSTQTEQPFHGKASSLST